jgi:hypothetical protein
MVDVSLWQHLSGNKGVISHVETTSISYSLRFLIPSFLKKYFNFELSPKLYNVVL